MARHHGSGIEPAGRRDHHCAANAHTQPLAGARRRLHHDGGEKTSQTWEENHGENICKATDP